VTAPALVAEAAEMAAAGALEGEGAGHEGDGEDGVGAAAEVE
jgi:hypothetical protein